MIEPREFVPLRHWGYFSDILTDKRDILKELVRYPGGGPKLLHPKGIMKKPLMGGGGGLTSTRSCHLKTLLMPAKSIFAKCLRRLWCDVFTGEQGPSCQKQEHVPDLKVFYVCFLKRYKLEVDEAQ